MDISSESYGLGQSTFSFINVPVIGSCQINETYNVVLFPQVSKIAAYAYSAISQIKVDAKEELVVQFAIP